MEIKKTELTALTGLRFWAAFFVFVFHVNLRTKLLFLPWPVYNIFSHGALGVTVFFVLSGFLLTYSHIKDFSGSTLSTVAYTGRFMYKRLARIYPAYLVGLLLFAGVGSLVNAWPNPLTLLADLSMTQAISPSLTMDWYGSGAWSVSIEVFFYLFFPWLLPWLLRIENARTLWLWLALVVAAGTFGGLSFKIWPQSISYELMYATPLFRCSEFIAGMLASLLVFRFGWRVSEKNALLMVIIAGTYIAGFGPRFLGMVAHNWLIVPMIIALLAAIIEIRETTFLRLLLTPTWIQYAGRVSYCFYLIQIPLFSVLDLRKAAHLSVPWWSGSVILLSTAVLAVLVHHLVEIPAHSWLLTRLNHTPVANR